jgi:hypothetical protein
MTEPRKARLESVDNEDGTLATVIYDEDDKRQQLSVGELKSRVGIRTLIGKTVYVEHTGMGKPVTISNKRT